MEQGEATGSRFAVAAALSMIASTIALESTRRRSVPRTAGGRPVGAPGKRKSRGNVMRQNRSAAYGEDGILKEEVLAKKRAKVKELQQAADFNERVKPRLRAEVQAPQIFDPSPPPRQPRARVVAYGQGGGVLVIRVPRAMARDGYKTGVMVPPDQQHRRVDRAAQRDFNISALTQQFPGVDFAVLYSEFEVGRDVKGQKDMGFLAFKDLLTERFQAAGLRELGRDKCRDILRLLGFVHGRRVDGAHYEARNRHDVVYHRDLVIPYLGTLFGRADLFNIISCDGAWFNNLGKAHGYINCTTFDGNVSRSDLGGIGMGKFGAVLADWGVFHIHTWERKQNEKVSICNDDICEFTEDVCKRWFEEAETDESVRRRPLVLIFDGARSNTAIGEETFDATTANLKTENKWNPLTGTLSLEAILKMLGKWRQGMMLAEAREEIRKWKNLYTDVLLKIERLAWQKYGVLILFLPHSHPELAFIEYIWRFIKGPAKEAGSSSVSEQRDMIEAAQAAVSGDTVAHARQTSESYAKYYASQLSEAGGDMGGKPIPRPTEYHVNKHYGAGVEFDSNMMVDLPPVPDQPFDLLNQSAEWKTFLSHLFDELHFLNMVCRYGKNFPVGQELFEKKFPGGIFSGVGPSTTGPSLSSTSSSSLSPTSSSSSSSSSTSSSLRPTPSSPTHDPLLSPAPSEDEVEIDLFAGK